MNTPHLPETAVLSRKCTKRGRVREGVNEEEGDEGTQGKETSRKTSTLCFSICGWRDKRIKRKRARQM